MSDPKVGTQPNTGLRVQIDPARSRQTANTSFGHVMSEGLGRGADAVMQAGQLAAPFIPGGAVLSAAISGVGTLKSAAAGSQTAGTAGALSAHSTAAFSGGSGMVRDGVTAGQGAPGAGGGDSMSEARALTEMNQSFNMQYLMLQQKMQDESRRFSVISNIMKTKHDTAKNSISNVR